MAGCVIPHTPLAVDYWKRRQINQAKLFFLSHMHNDHTEGLSSSWDKTIYCSEITKALAIEKFNIDPSLLVSIPVGQSTILELDETGTERLTVTLIDANHCPGAVMFLFEGYFGRILHTGDFRYFDGMLNIPVLTSNPVVNTLYLDNTYCDPICEFPTRTNATLMVLDIVRSHTGKDVVFGMDTLGKEDLLYKIAVILGVRIVVSKYRFFVAKLLGYSEVFTTDFHDSNFRVVPKHQVNTKWVSVWNEERPTIAILPTALYVGMPNPFSSCKDIFVVPYSDHSSFSEMSALVAKLKPQQIIPIVKTHKRKGNDAGSLRTDMSVFREVKSNDRAPHSFSIPASVLAFMLQNLPSTSTSSQKKKRKSVSYFNHRAKKKPCGIVFPSPQKESCQSIKTPIKAAAKSDNEQAKVLRDSSGRNSPGDKYGTLLGDVSGSPVTSYEANQHEVTNGAANIAHSQVTDERVCEERTAEVGDVLEVGETDDEKESPYQDRRYKQADEEIDTYNKIKDVDVVSEKDCLDRAELYEACKVLFVKQEECLEQCDCHEASKEDRRCPTYLNEQVSGVQEGEPCDPKQVRVQSTSPKVLPSEEKAVIVETLLAKPISSSDETPGNWQISCVDESKTREEEGSVPGEVLEKQDESRSESVIAGSRETYETQPENVAMETCEHLGISNDERSETQEVETCVLLKETNETPAEGALETCDHLGCSYDRASETQQGERCVLQTSLAAELKKSPDEKKERSLITSLESSSMETHGHVESLQEELYDFVELEELKDLHGVRDGGHETSDEMSGSSFAGEHHARSSCKDSSETREEIPDSIEHQECCRDEMVALPKVRKDEDETTPAETRDSQELFGEKIKVDEALKPHEHLSDESDDERGSLEESDSESRYCTIPVRRKHTNIYGGSCAFARKVLQKLERKQL